MKVIECKDEAQWLNERSWDGPHNLVVTASEGREMIDNPVRFYAKKKGLLPPVEQNQRMLWGKRLQQAIGFGFGEDTGRTVEEAPPYTIFLHPDAPFIGATLDFFQKDGERGDGILETKNVAAEWVEIPIGYQIQVQIQMACVPARRFATVAGLRGGNTLQWADVEPHAAFMKRFVSLAEEMQWRLIHDQPPQVGSDGSEETREALAALYPKDVGTSVALPPEALQWTDELEALKNQKRAIEEGITLRESWIKEQLKDATYGVLVDGRRYSWKEQTRVTPPRLEAQVSKFRVLKLLKGER